MILHVRAVTRERSAKNPGYVFATHRGSSISMPGVRSPRRDRLIAIRWSPYVANRVGAVFGRFAPRRLLIPALARQHPAVGR